ncbi:nuclear transport factor 2 family protein [Niabella defluvii]|nr:nuclear transport factor 2 family protein [Niabella sp. I65]
MSALKCLLLNALLSGSINALAQNNITQGQLQQTIGQLDRAHATAIFKGDSLALDSLMDDEVTVNHPTNRIVKEKNELLSLIRQGIIRYTTFERTPELFLFYENTVVVMGNEQVTPAPGRPMPES